MNSGTNVVDAEHRFQADEESALIAQASAGHVASFQQLYESHKARVYGICWRLMADKSLAEDAVQETFVQVWRKIDSFSGQSKFSTWLHSVATHTTLSMIRKQKSWWQKMVSDDGSISDMTVTEMPADLTDLDKLIAKLPERARLVFVLFAVEGYRHEEIGKMLNMAVGSSKAQYHRARQLLKESLEHE